MKVKTALISIFNKEGFTPIVEELCKQGITIYSTGGTEKFIKSKGIQTTSVESITDYPSILGGRVKTLHPKIFGGILNRKDNNNDNKQLKEFDIPQIDLVIVDLYPFEEIVNKGASQQDIIENIDIGGISLIRAAAKNYQNVVCVSSVTQYSFFLEILKNNSGEFTLEQRKYFATQSFAISSHYDTQIFNHFNKDIQSPLLRISNSDQHTLRYGENPHQKASFFGKLDELLDKLSGKELSYNNLLDVDTAVNLIQEFKDENPTFAILKHNNACGLAIRPTIAQAYQKALQSDPISAFGGILIANAKIDVQTAELMSNLFFEVIIAPQYSQEALEILTKKKNRIVLVQKQNLISDRKILRSCLNGILYQDIDNITDSKQILETVTKEKPSEQQIEEFVFGSKICKHTKSNAIVLVKDNQLLASGTGQTSRVDALKQAIDKAKLFNFDLKGSTLISDAFFPFSDCVQIASKEKITAILQPGGSIKDKLSIDAANETGITMVFTKTRHFKH